MPRCWMRRYRGMVQVGLVAPNNPRRLSTLDAIDSELVSDSLVHRLGPSRAADRSIVTLRDWTGLLRMTAA